MILVNLSKSSLEFSLQITSLQFSEKTLTGMGKLDNLFGSDNIMEKVLGLDFLISPRAYFCINTAGAEVLVQTISEMAGLHRNMTLLDICCGSGAIGLSLASKVGNVSRDFLFYFFHRYLLRILLKQFSELLLNSRQVQK